MIRLKTLKLFVLPAVLCLCLLAILSPAYSADDANEGAKKDAVKSMDAWLKLMDNGQYAESWNKASKRFQTTLTSAQWVEAASKVRIPLGALKSRKLASAMYQSDIPLPDGSVLKGQFVIAQFDSSFEGLASATETVSFEKEPDGTWKAAGYYIKPR